MQSERVREPRTGSMGSGVIEAMPRARNRAEVVGAELAVLVRELCSEG